MISQLGHILFLKNRTFYYIYSKKTINYDLLHADLSDVKNDTNVQMPRAMIPSTEDFKTCWRDHAVSKF